VEVPQLKRSVTGLSRKVRSSIVHTWCGVRSGWGRQTSQRGLLLLLLSPENQHSTRFCHASVLLMIVTKNTD